MRTFTIDHMIEFVMNQSPYYQSLYQGLNVGTNLEKLPLAEHSSFWAASGKGEEKTVFTSPMNSGIVFKSGGTAGVPKYSVFTQEEYQSMMELSGLALIRNGFETGDRVANLFYGGQLYASFLCIHDAIQKSPVELVEYPIMGSTSVKEMISIIQNFDINVIIGLPTTVLKIVEYAKEKNLEIQSVQKIYFGGETLYPDQRRIIESICPGSTIRSIFYALVDGGVAAYCDEDCGFNEHRAYDIANIIEIVDEETHQVIKAPGVPGKLVSTCLYRKLMPFIRYPLGDKAQWVEPEGTYNRKFELLERADEGARVGPVSIAFEEVVLALKALKVEILGQQLILSHANGRDKLTVRLAVKNPSDVFPITRKCLEVLYQQRPALKMETEQGNIHETSVEFCTFNALECNGHSGKIKRVIDRRLKKTKEDLHVE